VRHPTACRIVRQYGYETVSSTAGRVWP